MTTVTVDQQGNAETSTSKGKSDEELLNEARASWKICDTASDTNYTAARADLLFLTGGTNQWDDEAVRLRTIQKRPMITVNTLPTYLHQVTNDQRMNTPSIKVHPVDDKGDIETAKVIQGLIRHIEYDSNADVAEDTAVNSAAAIGFGYFRLITEFCDEDSFDQDIRFQRIRNALSVKIDPLSVEPDGSDMRECFVDCLMDKKEFKRLWPKANASNDAFFNDTQNGADYSDWVTDAGVLVCEWYRIETEDAELIELSDGTRGFADILLPKGEAVLPVGITVTNRRQSQRSKVMWRRITGCDILETTEIKCKWIPVFPVYGDEIDLDGQVVRSGIIRNAKGPAQMYNVFMTAAAEEVALRSKAPYIMAEGQQEGHEIEWMQANSTPLPYLLYKPTALGDKLAPSPQRNQMADVPTGMLAMSMHAADNVKKTTGLFDASLGARGTATSGKQELAQQKEGDVANYHYYDGLLRTLRHAGRCIVNMIPAYYDTERTVRILGEDDTASYVTLNQPNPNPVGEQGAVKRVLNDMGAGKYDVTVSAGPSFTTMRQESAEFFTSALQGAKDPASASVIGYLAMKNQDIPGAEIATKMMATLLPPPAKAVIDEENGKNTKEKEPVIQTQEGPLPLSQVPQALDILKQKVMQANEALQQADLAKQQGEASRQQAEVLKQQNMQTQNQLDAERVKIEGHRAETERFKAQQAADEAEAKTLIEHAQLQLDGKVAELEAINGDTTAFEAWKATLESDTRIRVAEIMARSSDRRAAITAQSAMQRAALPKQKETQS